MHIKNCRVFDGIRFLEGLKDITVDKGYILNITDSDFIICKEDINAGGRLVCPGLVDIHTHGILTYDISDESVDVSLLIEEYAKKGTTSVMPSTVTDSMENLRRVLEKYKDPYKSILGIHLEGPFLNIEKKGAHKEEFIKEPTIENFKTIAGKNLKTVKRVTIAPELDKGFKLVEYLKKKGISVSFGHTLCGSDLARKAIEMGYRISTHTFNAMPLLHHREPSITCEALNNDNVYCEIIPDLHHVNPDMIKLLFKVKKSDKTVIVSDSIPITEDMNIENGLAFNKDGIIAGSIISMADGVKNLIEMGIELGKVLRSATYNPAKAVGMHRKIGRIKAGYDADLVIFNDDFSILNVIAKGERILK